MPLLETLMALGPLLGGGLSAAGSLIGGNIASGDVDSGDVRRPFTNPLNDILLGALTQESLVGLGAQPTLPSLNAQSPLQGVIEAINQSPNIDDKRKRRAIQGLNNFMGAGFIGDAEQAKAVDAAIASVKLGGFSNLEELRQAELGFQDQQRQFQETFGPLIQEIEANRTRTLGGLAQAGADVSQNIPDLADQFAPLIERDFREQRERAEVESNVGRVNPAGILARLHDTEALGGRTLAIDRALQLLGGQVGIAQQSLLPAFNEAISTSAQRQNAALNLANIGQAQLQANQALSQQRNENQAQGVAGALGNLGTGLTNFALLRAVLGERDDDKETTVPPNQQFVGSSLGLGGNIPLQNQLNLVDMFLRQP